MRAPIVVRQFSWSSGPYRLAHRCYEACRDFVSAQHAGRELAPERPPFAPIASMLQLCPLPRVTSGGYVNGSASVCRAGPCRRRRRRSKCYLQGAPSRSAAPDGSLIPLYVARLTTNVHTKAVLGVSKGVRHATTASIPPPAGAGQEWFGGSRTPHSVTPGMR